MSTTQWSHNELADLRQRLLAELERLETGVTVTDIDAAVGRTLYRRSRAQAALARWDAGIYSQCCQCEIDIDRERLQQDPSTPFCADCEAGIGLRRRAA